jgi:hypothetical protein
MKKINVNELRRILQQHFRVANIDIQQVDVASLSNQRHPERKGVGLGGVLNIYFTCEKDPY